MTLTRGFAWFAVAALCVATAGCSSKSDGEGEGERGNGSGLDPNAISNLGGDRVDGGGSGDLLPLGGGGSHPPEDGGAGPVTDGGVADGGGIGSAGESGGDGGSKAGSGGSAGGSGGAGCTQDETRCGDAGRERCTGDVWVSDACPAATPACEDGACVLRGPSMVHIADFYIDSTEVTVAQYSLFLEHVEPDTDTQPEECSWNTSYYDGLLADPEQHPITNVDWCDAWAYCHWAGKRLCGAVEGGAVLPSDALDATKSEWFLACGGPDGWSHPNDNPDCNSSGGNGGLHDVSSETGCEGFKDGVFDLEGNAAEWIDSCDATSGGDDVCELLGGSYIDNQSYCTESFEEPRNTVAEPFGFRCCFGG